MIADLGLRIAECDFQIEDFGLWIADREQPLFFLF